MAVELQGFKFTGMYYNASASTKCTQFSAMKFSGTGCTGGSSSDSTPVVVEAGFGDVPCGVIQNTPYTAQAAEIMVAGLSKILIGTGGLTAGNRMMAGTGSVMVAAAASGYMVGQVAIGGASGEIGTGLISCYTPVMKTSYT